MKLCVITSNFQVPSIFFLIKPLNFRHLTLWLWKNDTWGLTHFDQFISYIQLWMQFCWRSRRICANVGGMINMCWFWTNASGDDYLQLWQPFCSTESYHLCKCGRGKYTEYFCDIILNLDKRFRRCCLRYFLSRTLAALLSGRAKAFVQFWLKALWGKFWYYSKFVSVV